MNKIEPLAIQVATTTEQRALPSRFDVALKAAAAGAARGVASAIELAAPYVPAGTVLSGALHSAAANATASAVAAGAAGAGPVVGAGVAGAAGALAGGEGDLLSATRAMQQESQSFNLQYLQLQEGMQRESREFQALSNVMKVRHDSAKSAIQNIH